MLDNKITFLLPTCEPDEMFTHLLPSLHNLNSCKHFIQFAICFQPPYTMDDVQKVLDVLNENEFEYKYFYKDYEVIKPYTPLIKMRNDCSLLYPDSLIYGLLDDDMSFEQNFPNDLNQVKYWFTNYPELSVIALKLKRAFRTDNCFATDCGLYYRGGVSYGFKGLMPENLYEFKNIKQLNLPYNNENLLKLFGGYQDKFCADVRLLNGGEALMILTTNVKHVENRKERGCFGHGWKPAEELDGSIAQFIIKTFSKEFLNRHSLELFNQDIICKLMKLYNYTFIKPVYFEEDKEWVFYYKTILKY